MRQTTSHNIKNELSPSTSNGVLLVHDNAHLHVAKTVVQDPLARVRLESARLQCKTFFYGSGPKS